MKKSELDLSNLKNSLDTLIECYSDLLKEKDDKIIDVLNISPSELFVVEHLENSETLANELIEKINHLKNNPEKLEEVYKVINAILNV